MLVLLESNVALLQSSSFSARKTNGNSFCYNLAITRNERSTSLICIVYFNKVTFYL